MRLADQAARTTIADALDDTVVVEAAAGTGKTTELVKRILRVLSTGRAKVGHIVAVTFTEKAAGELKLRLREALERERTSAADADVRQRLDDALARLEEAHVSTIHGFCAELLRERPVEARVDPLFKVLTEGQAERLFEEAFSAWMQETLASPPEGVRRALRRSVWAGFGKTAREDGPIDRLRRAAWELSQWRDFDTPWTRNLFDRDGAIDRLMPELHDFAAMSDGPSYAKDSLFLDTEAARHLSQEIALHQSFGHEDHDGWEARLVDLSRDRNVSKARHGRGPGYKQGTPRATVIDALDQLRAHLDQFRMDADADLAAALQQELRNAVVRYEALKTRHGAVDFLDLLLKARDLVKNDGTVRRGFQERFSHIFVDEFQDTDPLQAELLLLLAANDPAATDWREVTPAPGRLFIVGDPKQSIYRFRRADVGIYRDVCARLEQCGAKLVKLTTSFRSVPGIQACVNAAFAPIMTGDAFTLQAEYVPLSPFRDSLKTQPAVVALPVPKPYGSRNVSAIAIEQSLPDAVGAYVDWLVNHSTWKVTERAGDTPVPLAARHICILFRRFVSFGDDVTMPYAQALEARGVKHVLVGGKTFHDREEVETIRAALAAIEWPDDELSVFATLRGSLFAIGDEELLDWKYRFPSGFHPFRVPPGAIGEAHLRPVVDALKLLQRLHRRRNYIPVADTIHQLLSATRAHVALVLRPAGEQALANVLHVAELARQYEAAGGISFRGFVEELRVAADTAQAGEAPILEEGSDGVRMMTVHKAKGLEFPVVILADLTCKLSRTEAGRWIDAPNNLCALKIGGWSPIDLLLHDAEEAARDKAESERLTYVAATRARDLLVVPTIGDGPYEGGWLDPLTAAIYPPVVACRSPGEAASCPPFKSKDSVLNRPDMDPARANTVAPGMYAFPGAIDGVPESRPPNGYSVVWWDPSVLHLHAVSSFGLRRDDLIVKDGDMFAVQDRLSAYERWRADREQLVERGRAPSVRVQTATAWAAEAARQGIDDEIASASGVEVVSVPGADVRREGRPRGPRFGTLVHAVLAIVPLDADHQAIERTADVQGRILGAPIEECHGAVAVVAAVLKHDVMVRARSSPRLRRETPITWRQSDGTLIEGVLDLAFDEGVVTTVVDFKTDHELTAGESRYRAQLQKYVDAVAAATGRTVKGVLLKV
ncbi:MAG TPA: UvrD-helicase domain-containing protein [Vicinamibacterales bacterium]|nr:UvrD-helicase domain-containing protein [Vicinamibacterales bacterium]